MPAQTDFAQIIVNSPLFNADWYLEKYPDVAFSRMSAAEHFLKIGARIERNPGPEFNTSAYLRTYLDVAARGENPLVHFENHGRGEGRSPAPQKVTHATIGPSGLERVDVVVPVYNALEDVQACLHSLARCETGFELRALIINDGSDEATTIWLREACAGLGTSTAIFELIEHDGNQGYTKAVNTGLKTSTAPYIVTLNSDTIVTPFWLDGLVRCMNSAPEIGVTGPLSNAASWQNVPNLYGADGKFAINTLPLGTTPDTMAKIVQEASRQWYPRSTFVNGFCFMVRRAVLDAVGYMDEGAFPTGYGEENDFCIRAQDAGFELAFADDTYVFHAKSKSFGSARREELSKAGSAAIRAKHSPEKFQDLLDRVKHTKSMDTVRKGVTQALRLAQPEAIDWVTQQKILFLLPVRGGSGGAHSVVQEVAAMRKMGIDAKIAVHDDNFHHFLDLYGDIPQAADMFFGFRQETIVASAQVYDVVVATIYSSVHLLDRIITSCPWIQPAYYAQDYEPWFFEEGTAQWQEAYDSYAKIPGMIVMAKTHWICKQIALNHDVDVNKIMPSIDHDVYFPAPNPHKTSNKYCISAMIRPSTPRRGPQRTMELLAKLKASYPDNVDIHIFGSDKGSDEFQEMRQDFTFSSHGVLKRREVADLLRRSDIFIDLSDYQAFGRTSLEAMACGVLAMVPEAGGGDEYAIDGQNALVVDTFDVEGCYERLSELLDNPFEMTQMRIAGMHTAAGYSPRRAAMSELLTFAPALAERRLAHSAPIRPKVTLMPALTSSKHPTITGSGYVRLLCPYRQDALAQGWETNVLTDGTMPKVGTADIVVLQRDLPPHTRSQFESWHKEWRESGGRLIYEIDDDLTDAEALKERGYSEDAEALSDRAHAYAAAADLITVSTPHLATALSDYADKISLVPNFVDDNLWKMGAPLTTERNPKLKIGYFGTPTHSEDLLMVQGVLSKLEMRENLSIEVIGAFQRNEPLFGNRIGLPQNSVYPVFTEWLQKVAQWDIAIIPLVDNSFNRSKSNLKFVECSALGTAIVCSDMPEYRSIARNEENCLIVGNSPDQWETALNRLIEDKTLRYNLAQAARKDAAENWTVQHNANLYHSVLQKVFHET